MRTSILLFISVACLSGQAFAQNVPLNDLLVHKNKYLWKKVSTRACFNDGYHASTISACGSGHKAPILRAERGDEASKPMFDAIYSINGDLSAVVECDFEGTLVLKRNLWPFDKTGTVYQISKASSCVAHKP